MTIPLVRKRAKRPKTRTGCRTCRARHVKCDEARPTCARCSKAGRVCDGYDHVAAASASEAAGASTAPLAARRATGSSTVVIPAPSVSTSVSLTDREAWAFDFFRHNTIRHLPGNTWVFAWDKLIASMCDHPAVIHAAAAVGSLHRGLVRPHEESSEADSQRQSQHYQFALDQCNKAISFVRSHIETLGKGCSDTDVEIVLLVSLLFFCFEIFNADGGRAVVHFQTGIRILWERVRDQGGLQPNDKRVVEMRPHPQTNWDYITLAFVRLDHDMTLTNSVAPFLHAVVNEPMPTSFSSLGQAMVHLDALYSSSGELDQEFIKYHRARVPEPNPRPAHWTEEYLVCLAVARACTIDPDHLPEHVVRIQEQQLATRQWMSALAFVPYRPENEPAHIALQLRFFSLWIEIETWLDGNPMAIDRFSDQFEHMLELVERYIAIHDVTVMDASLAASPLASPSISSTSSSSAATSCHTITPPPMIATPTMRSPKSTASAATATGAASRWNRLNQPGYCLGTGLVECLVIIIISCRDSAIRRRCIGLLRTIDMSGVCDSTWLAAAMQCVVDLEERTARLLIGRDPDIDTRDLHPSEVPAAARLIEFDACESVKVNPEYYKEDDGCLVYAMLDGFGDVRVDAATFTVPRALTVNPSDLEATL